MLVGESCQSPIGIFWDIENCRVPKNKSATDLVLKIRKKIVKPNGYREFEFFCGCDTTTLPKQICEELNLAGVTIAHVASSSKNAADEKIKEQMNKFVDTHSSRGTVMLISGDVNFAPTLRGFRDRIGAKVLLMHSTAVAQELKNCADEVYNFTQFCEDLQQRHSSTDNNPVHVRVNGLPKDMTPQSIKRELQMSTQNRGGKVANVTHDSAIIKFPSQRDAERALGGIDGNKIGNVTVSAKITAMRADGQKQANAMASKKNKASLGAAANMLNMKELNKALPTEPNLLEGFHWQQSSVGNAFSGYLIHQNVASACVNAQKANVPVKENSKTFRLIVSGISGKIQKNEVRQRLLSFLSKKPKSVVVSDGSADIEFWNYGSMEEAFSKFNGLIFDGAPLTAHKSFKPRVNQEQRQQQQKPKEESLKQKWCTIQELWKQNEKGGNNTNVLFTNQSSPTEPVAPTKPTEQKSGRFMRVILQQKMDSVFSAKLQILIKANKGTIIDNSKQEIWIEFANQNDAEEAKRVFQCSLSAPGFCLNAETTKFIPPKIYEMRKKAKELQAKRSEYSTISGKNDEKTKLKETSVAQNTKAVKNKPQQNLSTESTKKGNIHTKETPVLKEKQPEKNKATYLLISGLSSKMPLEQVRQALSNLFVAYDGNVVTIENGCAYVKFDNCNSADAASQLFKDNNVTIMDKQIRAQLCSKTPKLALG